MPIWFEHMEQSGHAEKRVECRHCHGVFSYQLFRTVAYDSPLFPGSRSLLQKTCQRQLEERLARDVEPVSCPSCGYVQPEMTYELRCRFLRRMRKFAAATVVGLLGIPALIGIGAAWTVLGGISMRGIDFDWWGMIAFCLCGAVAAGVLVATGNVLARIRYPSIGFMPGTTLRNPNAAATVINPPAITPLAHA